MHFERDILMNKLLPRLNQELFPHGESADFIDLRWGIDTSELEDEESNKKVLGVCLDEIDEAKPYIIVLIGDRYGWVPPKELLLDVAHSKGISLDRDDISVTDLEITYSAFFSQERNERVLFFFRDEISGKEDLPKEAQEAYFERDPKMQEMLSLLKQRIIEKYPNQVFHYSLTYHKEKNSITGLDAFQKSVYSELKKNLMSDIKEDESLSLSESVIKKSHRFFEKLYRHAYVSPFSLEYPIFPSMDEEIEQNLPLFTLISGPSGSGRKTNLAIRYYYSLKNKDTISVPYVCGLNQQTHSIYDFSEFLKNFLYPFTDTYYESEDDIDYFSTKSIAELINTVNLYTKKKISFFIINADMSLISYIKALEIEAKFNFRVAFYVQVNDYVDISLPYYGRNFHIELQPLTEDEKYGVIQSILKKRNKELPSSVIQAMKEKKGADSPLYITLLVEKLLLFNKDDFEKLFHDQNMSMSQFMIDTINSSGSTVKELTKELLILIKERIASPMSEKLIGVLAIKELYASKQDLKSLFRYHKWKFNELSLSLFTKLIPDLFWQNEHYIHFFNDDIIEGAKEISQDYLDDVINWIENNEVSLNVSISLPNLYRRKNDVKKFTDLYLNELHKFFVKPNDSISIQETQVSVAALAAQCLKEAVNKREEFPWLIQQEFYNRLLKGEITNPIVSGHHLLSYIECYDDGYFKIKPFAEHYLKILHLYTEAYQNNPENDAIHAMFSFIVSQSSSIYNLSLYFTPEDQQFQQSVLTMVNNPEEQEFIIQLSKTYPEITYTLSFQTMQSLRALIGQFELLPEQLQQQIMHVVDQAQLGIDNNPLMKEIIENGIQMEKEAVCLSASSHLISTIFLVKLFKNDFNDDENLQNGLKLINHCVSYVIENDVGWTYQSFNSAFLNALDVFLKYQATLSQAGYDIELFEETNQALVHYLLLTICMQPFLMEALRVVMEGTNFGVLGIDETYHAMFYTSLLQMLDHVIDPKVYVNASVFIAFLTTFNSEEERDELYFHIMEKFFENISSSFQIIPDEIALSSFMDSAGGYLLMLERSDDEVFIQKSAELAAKYLTSYSAEDIVEQIHTILESDY